MIASLNNNSFDAILLSHNSFFSYNDDLPRGRFHQEESPRVLFDSERLGSQITPDTPMRYWYGHTMDPAFGTLVPQNYDTFCNTCKNYFCSKECINQYNTIMRLR